MAYPGAAYSFSARIHPHLPDSRLRFDTASAFLHSGFPDCVVMSLRRIPSRDLQVIRVGRELIEAISYPTDHKEIAALPAGARNDEKVIATQSLRRNDYETKAQLHPVSEFLLPDFGFACKNLNNHSKTISKA